VSNPFQLVRTPKPPKWQELVEQSFTIAENAIEAAIATVQVRESIGDSEDALLDGMRSKLARYRGELETARTTFRGLK
jgi:alkylation response protein AidB-like acyl-CoA dehydrogenase